jgi:sugar (pentulose or hexulose) kinase
VSLLVGLDVGTTAVKAAAFDTDLRELAHGRTPTPWRTVPTGAELDPDDLFDAAAAAARQAVAAAGAGQVAGVGVAGMAETGVLVDARDRPVVPSIAWHDTRGDPDRLARDLPGFPARTGLPASTLCTLVKYRWMRDHWSETASGVRWLNVAEWIVRGLGGELATELSLASRTGFYDLHTKRPWDDALAWADAPAGLAPEPVPAGTPMGTTGDGAVLTVCGHDHLAAAVGAGAAREGDVLNSCGTAEVFVRAVSPLSPEGAGSAVADGFTVAWHAVPGRQALQGAVWSGTALERILALVGASPDERDEIEAAALVIERARGGDEVGGGDERARGGDEVGGDDGVGHHIVLHGLGRDAGAPLTLAGIGRDASPGAVYHAALDAIGAAGADVLARMAAIAGPAQRLVVTGGWAAGEAARAVKGRHLGPFELSPGISQGARGAALAAGRAAGLWSMDDALQEVT